MKPELLEGIYEKFLQGKITEDEASHLHHRMQTNSNDLLKFEAYKQNWYLEEGKDASVDNAFKELKFKIAHQTNPQTTPVRKRKELFLNISKIAAIFIIGLFIGLLLREINSGKTTDEWYTFSAPGGQKSKVELADGTEIWINSESSLRVPSDGFGKKTREVELKGEAYFKVAKDEEIPFIVKTRDYDIKVMGTEFNVMAYKDFKRTETTLVEGMVCISKGENELIMKPGQCVVYSQNGFSLEKGKIEQALSWKDNKFYFDAITFQELVCRLGRWYDVKIEIKDDNLKNKMYSGVFKNEETIWQVLDVITLTSPIEYKRTGFRKIEIKNK